MDGLRSGKFFKILFSVCVHIAVSFLLPPYGSPGWNSGQVTSLAVSLHTKEPPPLKMLGMVIHVCTSAYKPEAR